MSALLHDSALLDPRRPHSCLRRARLAFAALFAGAMVLGALVLPGTAFAEEDPDDDGDGVWLMSGTWEAGRDEDRNGLWMSFRSEGPRGWRQNWSRLTAAEIEGLALPVKATGSTPVEFRVMRDAGAIVAKGTFSGSRGDGTYELVLDPEFATGLARRGVGRPTRAEHAQLLMSGAGFGLLDALARAKYETPSARMLVRMAHHGVNESYVAGMARLGYRLASLEALVNARDHGVDPSFIEGMAEAGYRNVEFALLLRARDHGADPDFAADLADAGYRDLPLELLIRARDHGVDAGYVESLARAGFSNLPLEAVIRARDHGLSGSYARRARARRPDASLDEVIAMKDRGLRP